MPDHLSLSEQTLSLLFFSPWLLMPSASYRYRSPLIYHGRHHQCIHAGTKLQRRFVFVQRHKATPRCQIVITDSTWQFWTICHRPLVFLLIYRHPPACVSRTYVSDLVHSVRGLELN
jgi:hypothetical protein